MRVAVYSRVSTRDKDQNPETQAMAIRDYCRALDMEVFREYMDQAPARDVAHRVAWRELMDDATRRRFKAVVVFKLDRAFRSVKDMHDTLSPWEVSGVKLISVREAIDTNSPMGRLLLNILGALSEFELETIRERVQAGMARAAKQGVRLGRPRVADRPGMKRRFGHILGRLSNGELSKRQAADELGIGRASLDRLIQGAGDGQS